MRRPKSSHRRAGGGGGGGGGRRVRLSSAIKYCLLFCVLPLGLLAYAVFGWRAWGKRGGAIASAARRGCFGTQVRGEERFEEERWKGGRSGRFFVHHQRERLCFFHAVLARVSG